MRLRRKGAALARSSYRSQLVSDGERFWFLENGANLRNLRLINEGAALFVSLQAKRRLVSTPPTLHPLPRRVGGNRTVGTYVLMPVTGENRDGRKSYQTDCYQTVPPAGLERAPRVFYFLFFGIVSGGTNQQRILTNTEQLYTLYDSARAPLKYTDCRKVFRL